MSDTNGVVVGAYGGDDDDDEDDDLFTVRQLARRYESTENNAEVSLARTRAR